VDCGPLAVDQFFSFALELKRLAVHLQSERRCTDMIIINIKENESIDKALKRFKKKFDKTGAVRELRARQAFTKPSVKRRDQIIKAAYKQKLQEQFMK
jgi:small subunit ribosomal protein S21